MNRNNAKCFSSFEHLESNLIIHIFTFCSSARDLLNLACSSQSLRALIYSESSDFLWKSIHFRSCFTKCCGCPRPCVDLKVGISALSRISFLHIDVCGTIQTLRAILTVLESKAKIHSICFALKLFFADTLEFCSAEISNLKSLDALGFRNLRSLTIRCLEMRKINLESTTVLLDLLGSQLTHLQIFPTSPRGILAVLHTKCPNLKFLRLDGLIHSNSESPFINHNLEEVYFSHIHPDATYLGRIEMPNVKRITSTGSSSSIQKIIYRLSIVPDGLEELELGDSSACASNEVIAAISSRLHSLRSLNLISEDRGHILYKATMQGLVLGCPMLHSINMSSALVIFDEGALEVLADLYHLTTLGVPFHANVTARLAQLLRTSKSTAAPKRITLVLREDQERDRALEEVELLQTEFPQHTVILEDF